jgi:hypothetical protein
VDVYKARADDLVGGVNDLVGRGLMQGADGSNSTAGNPHIPGKGCVSAAVDNRAIADEQIKRHFWHSWW